MKKLILLTRYVTLKYFGGLAVCGWKVVVQHNVQIRGARHIALHNNVSVDANVILQTIQQPNDTASPKIILEDHVGISPNSLILAAHMVHLEKGVMVGPSCVIVDYDHAYSDVTQLIVDQSLTNIKPIHIKSGVWIGANSTICAGVTIGKNSVVGANSVVTKDIPDFSVALGAPARVVKKYNPKTKQWGKLSK